MAIWLAKMPGSPARHFCLMASTFGTIKSMPGRLGKFCWRLLQCEDAAAASEYAIVLAFIAAAVAAAASQFDLTAIFPAVVAYVQSLIPG